MIGEKEASRGHSQERYDDIHELRLNLAMNHIIGNIEQCLVLGFWTKWPV